jgi:hypothetical protein
MRIDVDMSKPFCTTWTVTCPHRYRLVVNLDSEMLWECDTGDRPALLAEIFRAFSRRLTYRCTSCLSRHGKDDLLLGLLPAVHRAGASRLVAVMPLEVA